jgi:hypothetical protein
MLPFCNNYPADVWACTRWYHHNCPAGGDQEKEGWWHRGPGGVVFGGDFYDIKRYWYFFTPASDRTY